MSVQRANLSIQSYTERAKIIKTLQDQCARAESCAAKGEKVDMAQTAKLAAGLVRQFNEDAKAINAGTRITFGDKKAYDLHKNELTALNARINALSSKTNNTPAWVKPAIYTALAVAGVALTAFVGYKLFQSDNPQPQRPSPQATCPNDPFVNRCFSQFDEAPSLNLEGGQSSNPVNNGQLDTKPQATCPNDPFANQCFSQFDEAPSFNLEGGQSSNPKDFPFFHPAVQDKEQLQKAQHDLFDPLSHRGTRTDQINGEVPFNLVKNGQLNPKKEPSCPNFSPFKRDQSFSSDILEQLKFDSTRIDLKHHLNVLSDTFKDTRDCLSHDTRTNVYKKCIELIPSDRTTFKRPLDHAFVAFNMRNGCLSIARNAMRDQFAAQYIIPGFDRFFATGAARNEFSHFVDKCSSSSASLNETAIADCIVAGSKRSNDHATGLANVMECVESPIDGIGRFVGRKVNEQLGNAIGQYPFSSPASAVITGSMLGLISNFVLHGLSFHPLARGVVFVATLGGMTGYFAPHMYMNLPSLSSALQYVTEIDYAAHGRTIADTASNGVSSVDQEITNAAKALGAAT